MIGNFSNKLDEKGRMTIPSKFRDELGTDVVISWGFDQTLEVRTKEAFQEWSNSLIAKGNLKKDARQLQRFVLGNSFDLTIDKAGRVNVPNKLIEMAKIDREVTLVGIGDKLEVHATERWDAMTNDTEDLSMSMEELAEALAGE